MKNDVELIMLDKHNMKPLIDYINELQCYKERIEKAIEYIKNNDNFWVALGEDCGKPNDDLDKLLNILNGRSDE